MALTRAAPFYFLELSTYQIAKKPTHTGLVHISTVSHGGVVIGGRAYAQKEPVTWHVGLGDNLITPPISVNLRFCLGPPSRSLVYF